MVGTIIDDCNIIKPLPDSPEGQWYGEQGTGTISVGGGGDHLFITQGFNGGYGYPMRRIGTILLDPEPWIGIEWKLERALPAEIGTWHKIDMEGSAGGQVYAAPENKIALEDGWTRWWFKCTAEVGGLIGPPGFTFRSTNFHSGDIFRVRRILRAAVPTETVFIHKPVVNRPPETLTNANVASYYPDTWPYSKRRSADSYALLFLTLYAGSIEFARPLKPLIGLRKAESTEIAQPLTYTLNRTIALERTVETSTAFEIADINRILPVLMAVETSSATRLAFSPVSVTLGQAVETDQGRPVTYSQIITIAPGHAEMTVFATQVLEDSTEFFMSIENPVLVQAPGTLNVTIVGGTANATVTIQHEGVEIYRGEVNSDGYLFAPVNITAAVGGSVGAHLLQILQISTGGSTMFAEAAYTVSQAPAQLPTVQAPDATPVNVPAAVTSQGRAWVLQDPSVGGLGSWVMPINPSTMTSPQFEHALTSKHTTSLEGRFHIFHAAMMPKEWQMSGYSPTKEMADKLAAYRELTRRVYIIDHHGRAWKVAITHLEITPRLRHTFNGELSDWGSDWTLTVTVLDQNPALVS